MKTKRNQTQIGMCVSECAFVYVCVYARASMCVCMCVCVYN